MDHIIMVWFTWLLVIIGGLLAIVGAAVYLGIRRKIAVDRRRAEAGQRAEEPTGTSEIEGGPWQLDRDQAEEAAESMGEHFGGEQEGMQHQREQQHAEGQHEAESPPTELEEERFAGDHHEEQFAGDHQEEFHEHRPEERHGDEELNDDQFDSSNEYDSERTSS